MIRDAQPADASAICRIYNCHVRDTTVTFEDVELTDSEMAQRIEETQRDYPWLVLEQSGRVVAYAYATVWRHRAAYRHTAETAIYVDESCQGKGLGSKLYKGLIQRMKESPAGFHQLLGGIALPNPGSIALHEKLGFLKVAEFPAVGRKFDQWIDVGFWQLEI